MALKAGIQDSHPVIFNKKSSPPGLLFKNIDLNLLPDHEPFLHGLEFRTNDLYAVCPC